MLFWQSPLTVFQLFQRTFLELSVKWALLTQKWTHQTQPCAVLKRTIKSFRFPWEISDATSLNIVEMLRLSSWSCVAANFLAKIFFPQRMNGNEMNIFLDDRGHRNVTLNNRRSFFGYCEHGLYSSRLLVEKNLIFENCWNFLLFIKLRQRPRA